jgi:hypothetical protein
MDLTHFAKEGVSRSILNNPTFNVGIFCPTPPRCYGRTVMNERNTGNLINW